MTCKNRVLVDSEMAADIQEVLYVNPAAKYRRKIVAKPIIDVTSYTLFDNHSACHNTEICHAGIHRRGISLVVADEDSE
jgi:hypothetical protein